MDESEFEDYDRDAELALYREYRDVVKMFRFVVETERRFYLCNEVELTRVDTATDFYFELNMQDVWVWDIYRTDRFVKQVKVMTFKDVNVEEIGNREIENSRRISSRRSALVLNRSANKTHSRFPLSNSPFGRKSCNLHSNKSKQSAGLCFTNPGMPGSSG